MADPLPGHDPAEVPETGTTESGRHDPATGGEPHVACQFSVYPLRREHIGDVVEAAVRAAGAHEVSLRVQNLSTLVSGGEEDVFAAVRDAFAVVREAGSGILVATFSTRLPSDEEASDVQSAAGR